MEIAAVKTAIAMANTGIKNNKIGYLVEKAQLRVIKLNRL